MASNSGDNILLLDTTLRDGGLGLEDAYRNGTSDKHFTQEDYTSVRNSLVSSGVDIVELGSVEMSDADKRGFNIYPSIEALSEMLPEQRKNGQMYTALYRGPDTPIDQIPKCSDSLCESVRVIIRYSEMKKSMLFCEALAKKGYKVFVQPMLTMRYSDNELQMIIDMTNDMNAYALYFVDSYGYMDTNDIKRLYDFYNERLSSDIYIGFHAHNNLERAFSNVRDFLSMAGNRKIIVDSCVTGMGQGAGNLQTELMADFLNKNYAKSYNLPNIFDACDVISGYNPEGMWGYSVTRMIPAIHKAAYKYATRFRNHYHLSYREINEIMSDMPEDFRHRYTPENAEMMIQNGMKQKERG